jgi:hypothetical protein
MTVPQDWAPDACTLPTEERPLRVAEFDDLFAYVLRSDRREPTYLEIAIPADVEAAARDLARRESECCSFFTFHFDSAGESVIMRIEVSPDQIAVLDAIETRVAR